MKIVVIGGSGLIGTKLVKILRQNGHEVLAASRLEKSGVNTLTGEGLANAFNRRSRCRRRGELSVIRRQAGVNGVFRNRRAKHPGRRRRSPA